VGQNTVVGGRVHVDVVHTYPGASNHAKFSSALEQRWSHFRGAAYHQAIGIGDLDRHIRGGRCEDFPTCFAQQCNSAFTDFIGDNNFHNN